MIFKKRIALSFVFLVFFSSCTQLNEFHAVDPASITNPGGYPSHSNKKKLKAVILSDEKGTEITDLLIPFYLLSATESIEVRIISQTGAPISIWKGIFLLPQENLKTSVWEPDVIILPAVFHSDEKPFSDYISKYKNKQFLSICEGAKLIGESKQFNGYEITTHASSQNDIQKQYPDLNWKVHTKYTKDRNLISSAGVSSSVEASLILIEQMLGEETRNKVMSKIHYPYPSVKKDHSSQAVGFWDSLGIAKKITFDGDPKIGVEVYEGMNEFLLAAYLDSFARTFPSRIETFGPSTIRTESGLILYPTQTIKDYSTVFCKSFCESYDFPQAKKIRFKTAEYPFVSALTEVQSLYGDRFTEITKRLLDY